jgi:hypothetical protein
MLKSKTYFDQVPLEAVRRIVEAQVQRQAATDNEINKEPSEKAFAAVEEASTADISSFLAEEL